MTTTDPERIAAGLAEYDRVTAECPARKRHRGEKPCPRCRATSNEGCGLDASASHIFIETVRSAILETAAAQQDREPLVAGIEQHFIEGAP